MKEATGELNSSVIVITAVAMLAAFFFMVIWPNIRGDLQTTSRCSDAVCDVGYNKNNMTYCYTPGTNKKNPEVFECPYRG